MTTVSPTMFMTVSPIRRRKKNTFGSRGGLVSTASGQLKFQDLGVAIKFVFGYIIINSRYNQRRRRPGGGGS